MKSPTRAFEELEGGVLNHQLNLIPVEFIHFAAAPEQQPLLTTHGCFFFSQNPSHPHTASIFINKRNWLIKESIGTPIELVEEAWLVIGGSLAHQRVT